ncbi:hypothetical protein [Odoribacter lunatus]|uniref:type IX secretion system periplasmic lipoprotein PorW/SprE n=1 Tax=Odoribacter lunatus TaxID=2941335 RepID=UPI00203B9D8A|nr:hypothetical protein [Odoribacter lunatus]
MRLRGIIYIGIIVLLAGCSTKKNTLFSRQYHQLTTRYNIHFNGNEALKSGIKKMEQNHKEDYTNLLPVFVSNNPWTRALCTSDMDYAIEKAVKAIDKHSITAKPKRKKNKDSKNYETFRKKKEFNNQIPKCYLLLGKAYFLKGKYAMANNTFRYIQRQYADDEKLQAEVLLWFFRSLSEMGRYDEAEKLMPAIEASKLKRKQREMYVAAKTDFYVRQRNYAQAVTAGEELLKVCKSMKRKPRYYFMLSQLYLQEQQDVQAMHALKKAIQFNFNYEMVFNAKINMALAYQDGNESVQRKLKKMLKDRKNVDFQDRIYYALANIEEKKGNQQDAVDLYWKSVKASVDNDNQKALSFLKLGDYYFAEKDFVLAHTCYDSCVYFMDSRGENYDQVKNLVSDLAELVSNLNMIQLQDSLQRLAQLPEAERLRWVDERIQEVKDEEQRIKEQERQEQQERNFFMQNNMISRGDAFSQRSGGSGSWYFYNPVTVSLGKNDFKRKWGRRKLEDNWRRTDKSMVELAAGTEELVSGEEQKQEKLDTKSREFYLKDIPLTPEKMAESEKKMEDAYYQAGELYLYKFDAPDKALACFSDFIKRYPESHNVSLVYYLAYQSAQRADKAEVAESYKKELMEKFPESDFTKGLQDPEYFRKVDSDLKVIEKLYGEAYDLYQQVYYREALQKCEDIMERYPENKLSANVLFLKAMCVVNLDSPQEARVALNAVLEAKPDKSIRDVVNAVLASMDVGETPVQYTGEEMANARYLKANRHWVFDETGSIATKGNEKVPFNLEKSEKHDILIFLPQELKTVQLRQMQLRLEFINAVEAAEGRKYGVKKEDLWYKTPVLRITSFENYEQAFNYLNRIATDKKLLKNLSGMTYRIVAIHEQNLALLKRVKDTDEYVEFFINNYIGDRATGELLTGKQGTAAHIFKFQEDEPHDYVLYLPFHKVNMKRISEMIHAIEPAFFIEKEDYDDEYEIIVVRNVGQKGSALDYMNTIMQNNELFERLDKVEYAHFVITESNLAVLLEQHNIEDYRKFFVDNYLRNASDIGIEDGQFIYNKSVEHKFVLFYFNTIDPYKLKAVFEEFNFAGLTLNNNRYDEEHDCLVVSGFANREEAMRYFNTAITNRKLFRSLKDTDYRNFVISDANLKVLTEQKLVEPYLHFFKKYYLD